MSDRQTRSYDFRVVSTEPADDGLTLEGYAAVFNQPTLIRDFLGEYEETVMPGAFTKTLQERKPVLQFDHGTHPLIGSIPLGAIRKATEDDHGLHIIARLSDNWLVEPVRDAIRDGAVTGMSFQFQTTKDDWNEDQTQRTVREVKLYELGPVVFPAYRDTAVAVRSDNLSQIANLLSCENIRHDLAHVLTFGETEAATRTSDEPADEPPPALVDKKAAAKMARIAALVAAPSEYLSKGEK